MYKGKGWIKGKGIDSYKVFNIKSFTLSGVLREPEDLILILLVLVEVASSKKVTFFNCIAQLELANSIISERLARAGGGAVI